MTSIVQCFRSVVAHSPHSGQAADQVAMDSFYTELMSVTSPQTLDELVLRMGDFNAMVDGVRSEAIREVGAEIESKNGSRFREFLDGNSMCAINTVVGDGGKTWYGNGTVKAVRSDFICCHKSLLPPVVSCRILDGVELSENTRADHRALAVSSHSSTFHLQTNKKTRIRTRAPPKVSRVSCGDMWRQEAFQQCLLADGFLRSHAKTSPGTSSTCLLTKSFSCGTCGEKFPTLEAASTHEWTVHRCRQIGADYINENGRCPVCKRTFHTRIRAVKHVASVALCREGFAAGNYDKIPEAHRNKLDNADRVEARAAKKSGISV